MREKQHVSLGNIPLEFPQFSSRITLIILITNRLHISQTGNTFSQGQGLWGWRSGIEDLASGG
jgi:hypothetical protein